MCRNMCAHTPLHNVSKLGKSDGFASPHATAVSHGHRRGHSRWPCRQSMADGLRENFHCTYFAEDCSMYASEYSSDVVSDDDVDEDLRSSFCVQTSGALLPHPGFRPP